MKSLALLALLILSAPAAFGYSHYSGYCQQGGQVVVGPGSSSSTTKVQQSYPQATLTVYLPGTNTKSTLYTSTGVGVGNPITCSTKGYFDFYSADSVVDLTFSGVGISAPFTWGGTVGSPAAFTIDSLYSTLSAACSAAGSGTLAITKNWTSTPSQTLSCNLWFLGGGKIQPASGQAVTISGAITATALFQIFDYSSGGTVSLTGAKLAQVYPEWWGTSTATLTTAAFNAALLSRQKTVLSSSAYTLNGPVTVRTGDVIEGVNNNRVVVTLSGATAGFITGEDVTQVTVSNFKIDCNNSAQIGFRYAGQQSGGSLDATELDMRDMEIANCTVAAYSAYHSYGVVITNNWLHNSAINFRLEDGYNNTYVVIGGTISQATGTRAVYLGTGTSVFTWNSVVCQSNSGGCIEVNPTSGNSEMLFLNPYFENNCLTLGGYDFLVDFAGYQSPVKGMVLDVPHFNTGAGCTQPALIESVSDLQVNSPQWAGGTSASKSIVIGRGVVRPVLNSGSIGYVNHAGGAISPTNGRTLPTNLLRCSVAMDTSVCTGPFAWAASNGSVSDDGTLGPDGGMTWKLTYSGASSASPGQMRIPSNTLTWAGSLGGCGVWMRTDSGTAYAWANVAGATNYNGSDANAQRVILGTGWQWVWNSASTDSGDSSPAACNFTSYPVSGATAVYFQYPQQWRDQAGTPPYVSTTTTIFDRVVSDIGVTVFARLGSASSGRPIVCTNCTIANPTAGGGTGALAVPIGAVWVGK